MANHLRLSDIHTCILCSALEIDPLAKSRGTETFIIKYRGSRVFHGRNGCTFFSHIFGNLTSKVNDYSNNCFDLDLWIYELTVYVLNNQDSRLACGLWRSTVDDVVLSSERFGILALPGDPSSDYVLQRPMFYNYKGKESISRAISLLEECNRSHTRCLGSHPSRRPTRLLRINIDGRNGQLWIYLDVTSQPQPTSMAIRYSALSYCWGRDQEHKLEVLSQTRYEMGVAVSELPKTLQDAIWLSWRLDLKFIWIDCLCILQNNEQDLAHEIADLPAIFSNAYVTISASRAGDSQEGFLHPISRPPSDGVCFRLPYACPDGRLGYVILHRYSKNPIHSRAWTFQEYMLSPRILEYTSSQLIWMCREREWHQEEKEKKLVDIYQLSLSLHSGFREGEHCSVKKCEIWMTMVRTYSGRALKFAADKLPAVSALAERWSKQTGGDSYLAGLWHSHLPLGLLWLNEHPLEQQDHAYRAPSWSWASRNGSIAWYKYMLTAIDPDFKVRSSKVELVHVEAPYGAVSSGSLTVQGHLCRGTLSSNVPKNSKFEDIEAVDLTNAEIFWDYDLLGSSVAIPELFCLQICKLETKQKGPSGLMLVKVEGEQYCRVGLFHFRPLELADTEENEFVDIEDGVRKFQCAQESASELFRRSSLKEIALV